ncbi:hypothetical protein JXA80_03125 [bacterium]|nr:hypothetical protein [candidate division CSSED10-310 bacterium]
MTPPGFIKSLGLLFAPDIRRIRNTYAGPSPQPAAPSLIILFLGLLFICAEYYVSTRLFQHIMDQIHLEGLRYVLLAKLLQMVYLVFTVLLIYSNIVMSISSYFTSPEVEMMHCRPVSESAIFANRFIETFIRSSWMFLVFAVPILFAYSRVLAPDEPFFPQLFLIILPSLILPTAAGVIIGILLIMVFSPRRTQQVFLIMGIFLATGLIMIFRMMQPEKLIDPIGLEQVNFYLDTLRIPTIDWSPAAWAAEGIAAYGENRPAINRHFSVRLWGTALFGLGCAFSIFRLFWWKARSGGRDSERVETHPSVKTRKRSPASPFRCSLLQRDLILFNRDPGQWSQLIVIAALIVIYVFNFKNLPYELYGFQYSMAFVSVGAAGLILSALLARFGFPAVSAEGRSIWILQTGPINWRRYLWQKFLFLIIPSMLIGTVLVVFSVRILDVRTALVVKCVVAEWAIAVGCTGLAVGLGAQKPRFDMKDAAMVAVSATGLYYMITAVIFIVLTIGLVILPDTVRYLSIGYRWLQFIRHTDRTAVWILVTVITSLVVIVPMENGIRSLKKPID